MEPERWSIVLTATGLGYFGVISTWLLFAAIGDHDPTRTSLAILFMVSSIYFWFFQMIYHVGLSRGKDVLIIRNIDRATFFALISGYFTALFVVHGTGIIVPVIIFFLWVFTISGTVLLISWINIPRKLTPLLSFIQGIVAIVVFMIFISALTIMDILSFFFGMGLLVTGGIIYAIKKPDPKPDIFGFHNMYHGLTLAGSFCLSIMMVTSLI